MECFFPYLTANGPKPLIDAMSSKHMTVMARVKHRQALDRAAGDDRTCTMTWLRQSAHHSASEKNEAAKTGFGLWRRDEAIGRAQAAHERAALTLRTMEHRTSNREG